METAKSEHLEFQIAIFIFVAVCVWSFFRNFFGISVADESLYAVLADFPRIRGQWFVNDQTIQTTSALLMTPFVSLYTSIFGSEALLLFTRSLYILVTIGTALVSFRFLQLFCQRSTALILASVVIAFVPHGMICLNYNTMGSQFFAIASMLGLRSLLERRPHLATISAIFWVLCVFSYPTAGVIFLISVVTLLFSFRKRPHLWRGFLRPFLIGLFPPTLLLAAVLLSLGVDNILSTIEFSRHFNMPGEAWKIPFSWALMTSYLPPWWILAACLGLWIALGLLKPNFAYLGFWSFILTYIVAGESSEGLTVPVLWPWLQLLSLGLVLFHLRHRSWLESEKHLLIALILPAILGSLVTCLTSRMTVYNMYITGLFGALATTALVAGRNRVAGWLIAPTLLIFAIHMQATHVYEDDAISQLEHQISQGPFRFLFTTSKRGSIIEQLQTDLQQLPVTEATILFKDHFPAGHLMTSLRPVGPTINILPVFFHPEARPLYWQIYQNPANFADYIVEFRFLPITQTIDWVFMPDKNERNDVFHDFFMKTGHYKVILDRGVYRFLQKNPVTTPTEKPN